MALRVLLILLLLVGVQAEFPFRNTSLPWSIRVADLVSRLSLAEVVQQLARGGAGRNGGPAPGIPRLGIAPYSWNTECLRGDVEAGEATSFPQAIGIAAAFDPELLSRVANATGAEVRAKHMRYASQGKAGDHTGLSCFAPVINVMRHPLWGRAQETYGEDPFLTGQLATAFVKGLRGYVSDRFLMASAVCKHFAAHNGPEDIPTSRLSFNAEVPMKDMELTYLPAFEACTAAGARGVMCSYNRLNGVPACANPWLLTEVLRRRWRFPGYVVSDEGALEFAIMFHKYFKDPTTCAAAAATAGVDLELGPNVTRNVFSYLPDAMHRGWVDEALLRKMLVPLMMTRMLLGEFDPPKTNPYSGLRPEELIQSDMHRRLSLEAALRSFVLLKNDGRLIPWTKQAQITLVGPFARNMSYFYGDYSATRMPKFEINIEDGLRKLGTIADVEEGCEDGPKCLHLNKESVQRVAERAKILVLALGVSAFVETENFDRKSLQLPGNQPDLLSTALAAVSQGSPVLILLFSGTPVAIEAAVASPRVSAILWCGYPAQSAGAAVAATFRDENFLLAGRLPFTWYKDDEQVPSRTVYRMTNQTYRYFSGPPQFPFGFGLSLSRFEYSGLDLPSQLGVMNPLLVRAKVCNVGPRSAQEVAQLYIQWPLDAEMPIRQLAGVSRTNVLEPGSCQVLNFNVSAKQRRIWASDRLLFFAGTLEVFVGGQQPDQTVQAPSNVLRGRCNFA